MSRLFLYFGWRELFLSLLGLVGTVFFMCLLVRYPCLYIRSLLTWIGSIAGESFWLKAIFVTGILFSSSAIINVVLLPFEVLAPALYLFYWRFKSERWYFFISLPWIVHLLAFFSVGLLVLFNFFLDYWDFLDAYSPNFTGEMKNIFNFLRLQNPVIKSNQFSEWLIQDNVAIRGFAGFVWYSLRASVLGYRFEGSQQWLVSLPINSVAAIAYFVLGYQRMFRLWEILDDDPFEV
jgi:hypothetical protein